MTDTQAINQPFTAADVAQPGRFNLAGQKLPAAFGAWAERVEINWKRWNTLCEDPHASRFDKASMFASCSQDETSLRYAKQAYRADPAKWWREEIERAVDAAQDADAADQEQTYAELRRGE